jgi:hypothetical protein
LRDDDLWDIDANFVDMKPFDLELASSVTIPVNRALHDLRARITIDYHSNVIDAFVMFDRMPFEGYCSQIAGDYRKLVGLNLLRKFRKNVEERMGGINGCAHMNELVELLPYVAIQVMVFGEKETHDKAAFQPPDEKPFHLDACHALKTDGPAVAKFYPEWYNPPKPEADDPTQPHGKPDFLP